jgi:hypothetical protein
MYTIMVQQVESQEMLTLPPKDIWYRSTQVSLITFINLEKSIIFCEFWFPLLFKIDNIIATFDEQMR